MQGGHAENPPKAFLSHASEDKAEFVEPLARKLAELGVKPWLDKWEIRPGDRLVQRLFDEGLDTADAVVVVVSNHSVTKEWVREELDAATVRRVNETTRLIPVRLDEVTMPSPLLHIAWITTDRSPEGVTHTAQRIAETLHGHDPGPAVGPRPAYARISASIPGLTTSDSVLLTETVREALNAGQLMLLDWPAVKSRVEQTGLSEQAVNESLNMLAEGDYINVAIRGDGIDQFDLTRYGYDEGVAGVFPGVEEHHQAIIAELVNNPPTSNQIIEDLAERTASPALVVDQLLRDLQDEGKVSVSWSMGSSRIHSVSPTLRRRLS
ncbi:hypothetical protein BKD26_14240 [Streptomyces sp. CB03238]|nr:hypothetical protein BKD26_14240 [Streptomyces sp. CB03238]